jgi:hypothetical protein
LKRAKAEKEWHSPEGVYIKERSELMGQMPHFGGKGIVLTQEKPGMTHVEAGQQHKNWKALPFHQLVGLYLCLCQLRLFFCVVSEYYVQVFHHPIFQKTIYNLFLEEQAGLTRNSILPYNSCVQKSHAHYRITTERVHL